jgi:hypothetical protein
MELIANFKNRKMDFSKRGLNIAQKRGNFFGFVQIFDKVGNTIVTIKFYATPSKVYCHIWGDDWNGAEGVSNCRAEAVKNAIRNLGYDWDDNCIHDTLSYAMAFAEKSSGLSSQDLIRSSVLL